MAPLADAAPPAGSKIRARSGVIIVAFMNLREEDWRWNSQTHDADPGMRLPNYVIRSLDDGKTWQDLQKLHDDWTGAVRNMIQARDGRVVFTSMRLLNRLGRHSVLTYSSTDDGLAWKPSNIRALAYHHARRNPDENQRGGPAPALIAGT